MMALKNPPSLHKKKKLTKQENILVSKTKNTSAIKDHINKMKQ